MSTTRRVSKREYNKWVKWFRAQGYSGPLTGIRPSFEWVKRLAKELKKGTILETYPRDPRTIVSGLERYTKGRKRQLVESLKHPREKTEVTEMTSLPEKYLINHYQKLHEALEQFYDRLRIPELSELCLSTLEGRIEVSHLYASGMQLPAIIYEKGAVRLDIEDFFLWKHLEKHLVTEFPEFSENLGDWKKGVAAIVEKCHDITNLIATQLAKMRLDSAEPYLSRDSKDYAPGVYYSILVTSTYKCVIAGCEPKFDRISDDRSGLLLHVMEGPTGRLEIARGDTNLLDQVKECCLGIVSDDTIKKKVEQVLGLAKQAEVILEPTKQSLRLVLERGTFKGTCSVCADLVSQRLEQM